MITVIQNKYLGKGLLYNIQILASKKSMLFNRIHIRYELQMELLLYYTTYIHKYDSLESSQNQVKLCGIDSYQTEASLLALLVSSASEDAKFRNSFAHFLNHVWS